MPRISFKPKISIPPQTFPQRINVARAVQTFEEGAGGRVVTPPDKSPVIYASVPASIQDGVAKEMNIQGRLVNVIAHDVYVNQRMQIMPGDFLLIQGTSRVLIVQTIKDVSQLGVLFVIGTIEYQISPF